MLKRLFSTSTVKFSLKKLPDNPILPKNLGNNSPSTIVRVININRNIYQQNDKKYEIIH